MVTMTITYLIGDTRERIADLVDGSVSLVATSPPFVALRSYLPVDHPMKHAEIGSEPDPATFLDSLLALTAEWGRVLAPWGSIAVELGDTFAGSGGAGGDYGDDGLRAGQQTFSGSAARRMAVWPRPKCLALVPQAYALSLAYGRNVLSGAESPAGQWLVRNVIVWHRPNPAVGALGDKFRPSTSYIIVATRSPKRWFDLTAVRTEHMHPNAKHYVGNVADTRGDHGEPQKQIHNHPAGAPPLDYWNDSHDSHDTWTVTTQPSSLAHYAMWPPRLAERLVLSMCPEWVCRTCGEPRRRIERKSDAYQEMRQRTLIALDDGHTSGDWQVVRPRGWNGAGRAAFNDPALTAPQTAGWTDCGHDNYQPGVVLDPFAGSGTTLAVADCHGRDAIGIDLDERNRALLEPRVAEVRRTLFGVKPETPGQLSLLGDDQ